MKSASAFTLFILAGAVPAHAVFYTDDFFVWDGRERVRVANETSEVAFRRQRHPKTASCPQLLEGNGTSELRGHEETVRGLIQSAIAASDTNEREHALAVLRDYYLEVGHPLGSAMVEFSQAMSGKSKVTGRATLKFTAEAMLRMQSWYEPLFQLWAGIFVSDSAQLIFSNDGLLRGFRFSNVRAFEHFVKAGGLALYKNYSLDTLEIPLNKGAQKLPALLTQLFAVTPIRQLRIGGSPASSKLQTVIASQSTTLEGLQITIDPLEDEGCSNLEALRLKKLDLELLRNPDVLWTPLSDRACIAFAQAQSKLQSLEFKVSGGMVPTAALIAFLRQPSLARLKLNFGNTTFPLNEKLLSLAPIRELDFTEGNVRASFLESFSEVESIYLKNQLFLNRSDPARNQLGANEYENALRKFHRLKRVVLLNEEREGISESPKALSRLFFSELGLIKADRQRAGLPGFDLQVIVLPERL